MKDEQGRVTIPGYYDTTRISAADEQVLANAGDDEAALQRRVGIAAAEKVGRNYQESLQYPSLNVRGMAAAGVGKSAANVVPREAVAEIDIRTTTDANASYLTGLIRKFIVAHGYTLLDHEPSDDERARLPHIARLDEGLPAEAARQPMDAPVGRTQPAHSPPQRHAGAAACLRRHRANPRNRGATEGAICPRHRGQPGQ